MFPGPARAYTLRGKYRQFLLRVSANNVDEYMSANVVVHEDRTLDVVVEMVGTTLPVLTMFLKRPCSFPLTADLPQSQRSPQI